MYVRVLAVYVGVSLCVHACVCLALYMGVRMCVCACAFACVHF